MTRKRFLNILLSGGILGLMSAVVAVFIQRNQLSKPGECVEHLEFCVGCSKLGNCTLPQASNYKKEYNGSKK